MADQDDDLDQDQQDEEDPVDDPKSPSSPQGPGSASKFGKGALQGLQRYGQQLNQPQAPMTPGQQSTQNWNQAGSMLGNVLAGGVKSMMKPNPGQFSPPSFGQSGYGPYQPIDQPGADMSGIGGIPTPPGASGITPMANGGAATGGYSESQDPRYQAQFGGGGQGPGPMPAAQAGQQRADQWWPHPIGPAQGGQPQMQQGGPPRYQPMQGNQMRPGPQPPQGGGANNLMQMGLQNQYRQSASPMMQQGGGQSQQQLGPNVFQNNQQFPVGQGGPLPYQPQGGMQGMMGQVGNQMQGLNQAMQAPYGQPPQGGPGQGNWMPNMPQSGYQGAPQGGPQQGPPQQGAAVQQGNPWQAQGQGPQSMMRRGPMQMKDGGAVHGRYCCMADGGSVKGGGLNLQQMEIANAEANHSAPAQLANGGSVSLGPKEPNSLLGGVGQKLTEPGSTMRRYAPQQPMLPKAQITPNPEEMAHHLPTKLRLGNRLNVRLPKPSMKGLGGVRTR